MAVLYGDILKQAALRLGEAGSIAGSTMTAVEANFNSSSFGAGQIDNPAFPFSAQVHALLLAEEKIASVVAQQKEPSLRAFLRGLSDPLANRAALPVHDANGDAVIGKLGAVKDASDGTLLTEIKDVSEIERKIRLRTSILKCPVYEYAIDGATLLHTRAGNVVAEVCKYNKATQKAAILANAAMLFPDALEESLVCGTLAYLFRFDEAPDTARYYVDFFRDTLSRIEGNAAVSGGITFNPEN